LDIDLNEIGPQSLLDNDLKFSYIPIDPRVGQVKFYQTINDLTKETSFQKVPLALGDCEAERPIIESLFEERFLRPDGFDVISLMRCLKDDTISL
jgi:hypothetical protein